MIECRQPQEPTQLVSPLLCQGSFLASHFRSLARELPECFVHSLTGAPSLRDRQVRRGGGDPVCTPIPLPSACTPTPLPCTEGHHKERGSGGKKEPPFLCVCTHTCVCVERYILCVYATVHLLKSVCLLCVCICGCACVERCIYVLCMYASVHVLKSVCMLCVCVCGCACVERCIYVVCLCMRECMC